MDLYKTFDTLAHFLLIAKLEAYSFDTESRDTGSNYIRRPARFHTWTLAF